MKISPALQATSTFDNKLIRVHNKGYISNKKIHYTARPPETIDNPLKGEEISITQTLHITRPPWKAKAFPDNYTLKMIQL